MNIDEIIIKRRQAEKEVYDILLKLQKEVGLKINHISKRTTAGGTLDPWCSMKIEFVIPD